jgi:hypothetical protein
MTRNDRIKLAISLGAVLLLAAHIAFPRVRLEPSALGLAALAVLPWLSSIIDSAKVPGGWEVKFRQVQDEQMKQREDLDGVVRFLFESFVTRDELVHLEKLAAGSPFPFRPSPEFEKELRRLIGLGLIARKPGRGIRSMFEAGDDVRKHLDVTDRGREYLQRRNQIAGTGHGQA